MRSLKENLDAGAAKKAPGNSGGLHNKENILIV